MTDTAAAGDCDLQHVLSRLTDVLEVDRPLTFTIDTPVDLELVVVDPHRHRRRPVGLHLMVLVVKRLQLHVQLRPVLHQSVPVFSCTDRMQCVNTNGSSKGKCGPLQNTMITE